MNNIHNKEQKFIQNNAILSGYDGGLIWEYKNPFSPNDPLWIEYLYGYILGTLNIIIQE